MAKMIKNVLATFVLVFTCIVYLRIIHNISKLCLIYYYFLNSTLNNVNTGLM